LNGDIVKFEWRYSEFLLKLYTRWGEVMSSSICYFSDPFTHWNRFLNPRSCIL